MQQTSWPNSNSRGKVWVLGIYTFVTDLKSLDILSTYKFITSQKYDILLTLNWGPLGSVLGPSEITVEL